MNGESCQKAIWGDLQLVSGGGVSSKAVSEASMTSRSKAISVEGGNASWIEVAKIPSTRSVFGLYFLFVDFYH